MNRQYYVATDLQSMESEIFTTKKGVADYLSISVDTIRRGMKKDWRIHKKGKYLICKTTITKSKNKGNIQNLTKRS